MCIRDSVEIALQFEAHIVTDLPTPLGQDLIELAAAHNVAQRTVCLLYTSDAADERSSVDLGGRRIIKKKKK